MLAYAGDDDARALRPRLFHHQLAHHLGVVVVEVAYGLVGEDEVEGLRQCPHHGHALLLAEGHEAHLGLHLVGYAEALEPRLHLPPGLEAGELVLYLHVFHGGEFGEEAQLLEEVAHAALAQLHPVGTTIAPADAPGSYVLRSPDYTLRFGINEEKHLYIANRATEGQPLPCDIRKALTGKRLGLVVNVANVLAAEPGLAVASPLVGALLGHDVKIVYTIE